MLVAGGIVCDRFWRIVHGAVKLDDKPKLRAKEIDDESVDDMLSPEVVAIEQVSP
jgi:hypothetical protein